MGDSIYKYPLKFKENEVHGGMEATVDVPSPAKFVDVQLQRDQPVAWFEVDPSENIFVKRTFILWGTGWPRHGDNMWKRQLNYRKTVQNAFGLVFHIYSEYF